MDNATRFLDAFTAIEQALKQITGRSDVGFTTNVQLAISRHALIKYKKETLIEYAQLRNAIVHHRVNYTEVIAEPHLTVVEDIEEIARALNDPLKKPVYEILDQIEILFAQGKRVKVVLVSQDGQADQVCLGLLTLADIGRLRIGLSMQ